MSGRATTLSVIKGRFAISVNDPGHSLPRGWNRIALIEIAELRSGHTPSRNQPEYWGGKVQWVGIRDAAAHHGGVIHNTNQAITELGLKHSAAVRLPKDTVCLSRTASVGYVVKMGGEMATSQDFVNWICSPALDPDYLMRALLAEGSEIRRFGEGSTHTTIYFPAVKAFHIDLPPLAEQKRIVAKLDALSAKSARARTELARIETLVSRYKQALLGKAFSGELTSSKVVHWLLSTLGELAVDVRYGTAAKCEFSPNLTPVLRIPNVARGRIDLSDLKHASFTDKELSKLALAEGDILVIRSNGSVDLVGRSAVVSAAAVGMLFAGYLIRIRLDLQRASPSFIQHWMQSSGTRRAIEASAKSTSGVNNVNSQQLQSLHLRLPPIEEQHEIVRRIETAFARIDHLADEAKRALTLVGKLDEAILAKAFRGELVPQHENDEPASVLLERIRAGRASAPKPKRRNGRMVRTMSAQSD